VAQQFLRGPETAPGEDRGLGVLAHRGPHLVNWAADGTVALVLASYEAWWRRLAFEIADSYHWAGQARRYGARPPHVSDPHQLQTLAASRTCHGTAGFIA
jgi:hypothetical protein